MAVKKPLCNYGGKTKELQSGDTIAEGGVKITALPAATSVDATDLFAVVKDPSGTAVTKSVTGTQVKTFVTPTRATYQATPADPTGTTSTSGVMMGLAGSITPASSGKILIMISGDLKSSSAATLKMQIRYGTGSAPGNGGALTGTAVGNLATAIGNDADQQFPTTCNAIISSLSVGTAYWIDVSLSTSAGTGTVKNISMSVMEI